MFQFPAFAPCIHGDRPSACRVAPFGHMRIKACLQLPAPFRSFPRPSSPPDSLGILRSLLSSFSRESRSLLRRGLPLRSDSIRLVAYEIAVPNSQLEKTLEFYKLQTDSIFYLYLLFSLNVVNELKPLFVSDVLSIVVSQTGCKDTHFFITSKLFRTFF